jgi:hypothetical protein
MRDEEKDPKDEEHASAATAPAEDERAAPASTSAPPGDPGASTGRVVRVEVPIRVESPNRLHAEHPGSRARRVRRERSAVREALARFDPPPGPWVVYLVRVAPRRLDDDNAVASMKGVRDEVASCLRVDDGDARVRFVVGQERGPYTVRVEVRTATGEVRP